jgi:hypothetical protein
MVAPLGKVLGQAREATYGPGFVALHFVVDGHAVTVTVSGNARLPDMIGAMESAAARVGSHLLPLLDDRLPLCTACAGAIGGAGGGPDRAWRPAVLGETCGARDHVPR